MIISLTPKQDFQKNKDLCDAYRAIVDSQGFKDGVHLAMTEVALHHKLTAEQWEGVNIFLKTMLNMAEKEEPNEHVPFMNSIASLTPKPQPKK